MDERRLTAQGLERKEQLLTHAARLFAERGYRDTRVIDICRAAGVAKGLFYWYFENKDELFGELADGIRQRLRRAQADSMDPEADPLTRVRQGAEASVRFMSEHVPFFSVLEVEPMERRLVEILRRGTDVHIDDVAALVRQGIAAGLVRDEDPTLLARGVVGIVGIYGHLHRTGRTDLPVEDLARFVGDFVVAALSPSPLPVAPLVRSETASFSAGPSTSG